MPRGERGICPARIFLKFLRILLFQQKFPTEEAVREEAGCSVVFFSCSPDFFLTIFTPPPRLPPVSYTAVDRSYILPGIRYISHITHSLPTRVSFEDFFDLTAAELCVCVFFFSMHRGRECVHSIFCIFFANVMVVHGATDAL